MLLSLLINIVSGDSHGVSGGGSGGDGGGGSDGDGGRDGLRTAGRHYHRLG